MAAITICLGSSRPGGLDITFEGLRGQTFQDFEVVFVDGLYHERHREVLEAWDSYDMPQELIHVPNHRYSQGPFGTTCAGLNTGFALAAAPYIVILLDYAYCRPNWLATHMACTAQNRLTMAGAEYRTLLGAVTNDAGPPLQEFTRATVDGIPYDVAMEAVLHQRTRINPISCFEKPFKPDHLDWYPLEESDTKCTTGTGRHEFYGMVTKNESFPTEKIFEVGGMDEIADLGRFPADPELGWRLVKAGLEPWNVQEAVIHCVNPRKILPNLNIIMPESGRLPHPFDYRVSVEEGNAWYDQMRDGRVRKPHNLEALKDAIWSWRDMSQRRDAVIPKNVVSDKEYYGL